MTDAERRCDSDGENAGSRLHQPEPRVRRVPINAHSSVLTHRPSKVFPSSSSSSFSSSCQVAHAERLCDGGDLVAGSRLYGRSRPPTRPPARCRPLSRGTTCQVGSGMRETRGGLKWWLIVSSAAKVTQEREEGRMEFSGCLYAASCAPPALELGDNAPGSEKGSDIGSSYSPPHSPPRTVFEICSDCRHFTSLLFSVPTDGCISSPAHAFGAHHVDTRLRTTHRRSAAQLGGGTPLSGHARARPSPGRCRTGRGRVPCGCACVSVSCCSFLCSLPKQTLGRPSVCRCAAAPKESRAR